MKKYYVTLYFENGTTANMVLSTKDKAQIEAKIKSASSLTCQTTKKVIDTSKVFSYEISK